MAKQVPSQPEALSVYAALLRAREEFAPVVKDETADVGKYTYKYVELSTLLAAVTPALSKYGLIVVQTVDHTEHGPVLVTRLVHVDSGTEIGSSYPLQPARPNDPQALGGAVTYARRYALLCILGVAPEDDDGQKASRPVATRKADKPADYEYDRQVKAALAEVGKATSRDDLNRRFLALPESMRKDKAVNEACKAIARRLGGDA